MNSQSGIGRLVRAVGMMLYGAVGIPYFGSPLIVPYPVAFFLWATWIFGLVVAIRQSKSWPWAASISALTAMLFWVLFVQTGSWIFGWTA